MQRANPKVIDVLNEVLTAELTAINQYFIHAKMLKNWGYNRLAAKVHLESIDEMKHADDLIERILYLGGIPNMQRLWKVNVGETVPEQFACDKALEDAAIPRLSAGIDVCREAGDHGTAAMLETILVSEEEHLDWLEAQLELVGTLGLENYLTQQIYA
ncbi:MAG TPA: bacterioferritin [Myxococcales bacterium]|nr:bacterioferritin [Myxococcales bacterium]HBU48045.1 bacterioferritin [Myxococcales bacterium]|tara:strand:- start:972 stop:1445 length:474 start_codon:yes stop_codon:yes gene_type:complete